MTQSTKFQCFNFLDTLFRLVGKVQLVARQQKSNELIKMILTIITTSMVKVGFKTLRSKLFQFLHVPFCSCSDNRSVKEIPSDVPSLACNLV